MPSKYLAFLIKFSVIFGGVMGFAWISKAQNAPFVEINFPIETVYQSSVAWGDYNNDERLDLIIMGWDETHKKRVTHLFKNSSDGLVDSKIYLPKVNSIVSNNLAWGDYDNDGNLDLILTGNDGFERVAHLFKNEGQSKFREIKANFVGVYASSVAWGDYDNDGKIDLLVTGQDNERNEITKIYHNTSNGFKDLEGNFEGVFNGESSWTDFDNDGYFDFMITGRNAKGKYVTRLYHNNQNGTFSEAKAIFEGLYKSAQAWADYNDDGLIDLLLAGSLEDETKITKLYKNDGNGLFSEDKNANFEQLTSADIAWGDYDNDGKIDVIMMGIDKTDKRKVKLYKNLGGGKFEDVKHDLVNIDFGSLTWGDFDKDKKLDLILTGQDDAFQTHFNIYKNETPVANQNPNPPTNLVASVKGNEVTLSWDRATDNGENATSSNSLSYNIYVGTSLLSSNIVSPMSDLKTGFRRVIGHGNNYYATQMTIRNLPPGTYHWSVQSIDNSFAGSKFAEEHTFTIEAK
ncbi:MAG TPA: VCBS repeat-containing protein [Microscillaceae bacterium]|nr:VCBS repeat-containing protein [Microscillaceae bacterium]